MSRIRANTIVNGAGTGAPNFPRGAIISGISTINADLNATNVSFSGITTTNQLSLGTGTSISSPATNELALGTNGTEKVRITSAGRVGIGTDSPTAKLEVATSVDGEATLATFKNTSGGGTNETVDIKLGLENIIASNVILRAGKEANHSSSAATDNFFSIHTTSDNTSAERLRIDSSGEVQIANGNLKFSTAGTGIDFSATSDGSGTATSELLDDYEEGTWDPIFSTNTDGASSQTYAVQRGRYTKIGRIVNCSFDVQLSNKGTFTGNYITLGGLPYTGMEGGNCGGTMTIGYHLSIALPTGGTTITAYINTSNVYLMTPSDASGSDYMTVADSSSQISATSRLIGQLTLFLTS